MQLSLAGNTGERERKEEQERKVSKIPEDTGSGTTFAFIRVGTPARLQKHRAFRWSVGGRK